MSVNPVNGNNNQYDLKYVFDKYNIEMTANDLGTIFAMVALSENALSKSGELELSPEAIAEKIFELTKIENELAKEEILNVFSNIAAIDNKDETLTLYDIQRAAIEKRNEETPVDYSFLEDKNWTMITPKEDKFLGFGWKEGTETFHTKCGVKVKVSDAKGVEVYENTETNEVIIINAHNAKITSGSKDVKIRIYNSTGNDSSIKTGKGNDNIELYNSSFGKISTGKGIDSVKIYDSNVDDINTGRGSDFVDTTSSKVGNVNTSSTFLWGLWDDSDDNIFLKDTKTDEVKTGGGNDNIIASSSFVNSLSAGAGNDSISVNQTELINIKEDKKDTVVKDGNYFDFDTTKIFNIETDAEVEIQDGTKIPLKDYSNYVLSLDTRLETEEEYQEYTIETLKSNLETMKQIFEAQETADGWCAGINNGFKDLTGMGITDSDVKSLIAEQEKMIQGLTDALNGKGTMNFEEAYEYYTGTTYSQEKIEKYLEISNTYSAIMVGCQNDEDYAEKFEKETGKSIEEISQEFALCQLDTFGKSNQLQSLVEKYSLDQQTFADNLSAVISTVGIVCMVVGGIVCIVCPPAAPLGAGLMTAGKYVSVAGIFTDNAIDLVDDSTDKDGLTWAETGDIALETGIDAVSYFAGKGIGKLSNTVNNTVTSSILNKGGGKIVSYVFGQSAETGLDMALSLSADFVISETDSLIRTGEFIEIDDYWSLDRFLGEGQNQLMGILSGVATQKVDSYRKTAITNAQNEILNGNYESAKLYLKTGGISLTEDSFNDFVTTVKELNSKENSSNTQTLFSTEKAESENNTTNPVNMNEQKNILVNDGNTKNKQEITIDEKNEIKRILNASGMFIGDETDRFDDIQFEQAKFLLDSGISAAYIKGIFTVDADNCSYFISLLKNGEITASQLMSLYALNVEEHSRAVDLLKKGVDSYLLNTLATLPNDQYERALDLLDKGIETCHTENIAKLSNSQYKRALDLIDKGVDNAGIKSIAEITNEEQYLFVLNLLEKNVHWKNAINYDNLEDVIKSDKLLLSTDPELWQEAEQYRFIYNKSSITELSHSEKKKFLDCLISSGSQLFTNKNLQENFKLLPKDQESYCTLLHKLAADLVVKTKAITEEQSQLFDFSASKLTNAVQNLSDEDFKNLDIKQSYDKDSFILDVIEITKKLPPDELQKVYNYFGFELCMDQTKDGSSYTIKGYPVNLGENIGNFDIVDFRTKIVVENLRNKVIEFSENNKISCNNQEIEKLLNEVISVLPELRPQIGKIQQGTPNVDAITYSLNVMQKMVQNPKFSQLNDSDKKVMFFASILKNITQSEGQVDKTHASQSAIDACYIVKKFNFSKEEEIKLYTLIKNHEWLEFIDSAKTVDEQTKYMQSVAYNLRQDNLFEMAMILAEADLKAENVITNEIKTTSIDSAKLYAEKILEYVKELEKSQPLLPVTKVPNSTRIREAITVVRPDGSTNIKGVYVSKEAGKKDLIIIKFNEVEAWEQIGFPAGSVSRGILSKGVDANGNEYDIDTGNIKFFVHRLDYISQVANIEAFSSIDSDALLSISYSERPESKYRFFSPQGLILDFATKYIHGGGNTDMGSGCGKSIQLFIDNYIFGGEREADRLYVSNLIKEATGFSDEQYVQFIKENANKPFVEIEPIEIRNKIIAAFATINSNTRAGNREYNEMYGSNPDSIMAVFAYNIDKNESIQNPLEFLSRNTITSGEKTNYQSSGLGISELKSVSDRTDFLQEYAREHDIPFIIFGD